MEKFGKIPDPCPAFLVSDKPNVPLIESGAEYWAWKTFVGPSNWRHFIIAFGLAKMWISEGPLHMNVVSLL